MSKVVKLFFPFYSTRTGLRWVDAKCHLALFKLLKGHTAMRVAAFYRTISVRAHIMYLFFSKAAWHIQEISEKFTSNFLVTIPVKHQARGRK